MDVGEANFKLLSVFVSEMIAVVKGSVTCLTSGHFRGRGYGAGEFEPRGRPLSLNHTTGIDIWISMQFIIYHKSFIIESFSTAGVMALHCGYSVS